MKSDEEKPEVKFGERLVVHSPGHFREPVVERSKGSEQNAADDHVVEMRDHEVRTPKLPVKWGDAQHDSGEARDKELEQEADAEQHRSFEMNLPTPHGRKPVEDLNAGGNGDGHRRQHKKGVRACAHPDSEHMVSPDAHADKSDAEGGGHHHRIAENRFTRENRDDFGGEGESWNDQDINLRMAEDPEKMHPDNGRTSGLGIEEMRAQITVDQQHRLRRRQRADRENH